ncbi:MAG TPA: alpha/beta fold hydrolase [Pirellulaceae bacterium]|nr:alpha/beta fold hydrolase [Pirellulaceae bacterium]
MPETPNETVVLLHGFGGNRLWMRYLASSLRAQRYDVRVWGYPSLTHPIDRIGERFARYLEEVACGASDGSEANSGEEDSPRALHVVAHSMGNLVTREALTRVRVPIRRMVMLAPPNGGSFAADRFAPWVGAIFKPLRQMRTCAESYVHSLAYPDRTEIGIIAASHDFVVAHGSSIAPTMVDRVVVQNTHSGMLLSPETARHVAAFLRDGRFTREASGPVAAERRAA